MAYGDPPEAEVAAEELGTQHIVQIQHGIEALQPQPAGIAHQPEEAALLAAGIYGHGLEVVGRIDQQLRHEGLRQEDEVVLLVGPSYSVEEPKEHRHVPQGGEANDEVARHRGLLYME